MLVPRFLVPILPAVVIALSANLASGQSYPNKPVRIVTTEPGSGADLAARLIAQELTAKLGQQVIVENRGGSGIIPAQIVAKAPPDGYTMLFYGSAIWLLPFLQDNVPYDPVRDFSPITLALTSPNVLVVPSSLAPKSVKELIALARANPGQLSYASGVTATTPHLAAELFKAMADVNILRVSYKGTAPALNDLIGGQVQLMFPVAAAGMPHVKSGRLRALAVTSAQPTELAAGLPTMADAGLPGYEAILMLGAYAPAKTPARLIDRLNQEIVRVLHKAEVKERLFRSGAEVVGSSPEQLLAVVKSDLAKWGKVIKDAGIRGE